MISVTLNDVDSIRAFLKPVNGIAVDSTVAYLFDPALFEAYIELARKWAVGTIVEQPLGSSRYWAEQAAASAISIDPTNLVHITGTETITGIKTFSETILGNISTATSAGTLTTARNIAISGMATGTATSFNGSADISIPITAMQSASASQAGVVDTAAQTFAGVKTFSSSPIVPTPTTDYQAATKAYADSVAAANYLGTCSTASATAAKTVAITGFALSTGVRVKVKFDNANTTDTPTLNIESTGAKAIYNEAGVAVSATSPAYFPAGATVEFYYDGTNWVYVNRIVDEYINGYLGYEVSSNGKIKQWGRSSNITGAGTITFLKSFKNTTYNLVGSRQTTATGTAVYRTVATLYGDRSAGSFPVYETTNYPLDWKAEGY